MSPHEFALLQGRRREPCAVVSAESRRVSSGAAEIYYESYGNGPALLLIPGAFDNLLHWSLNVPALVQAGYRVLAMNLRGHFLSPCPDAFTHFRYHSGDIEAVLLAENLDEVAILASSFGGFGAVRFARSHPEVTRAIVLSGSTCGVFSERNYANNAAAVAGLEGLFASGSLLPARVTEIDGMQFLYRQMSRLGSTDGFLSCPFQAVKSMDDRASWLTPADLSNYTIPTLLVGGDSDDLLSHGFQRETVTLLPGAELSDYSDSGHRPFWEMPDRYNDVAREFLQRHYPAP